MQDSYVAKEIPLHDKKIVFDTLAVKVLRVFYLCRSISKPWFFRAVFSSHSLLLALFSPHPLPVVIFFFCVALSYRPCGLILFSYMCCFFVLWFLSVIFVNYLLFMTLIAMSRKSFFNNHHIWPRFHLSVLLINLCISASYLSLIFLKLSV